VESAERSAIAARNEWAAAQERRLASKRGRGRGRGQRTSAAAQPPQPPPLNEAGYPSSGPRFHVDNLPLTDTGVRVLTPQLTLINALRNQQQRRRPSGPAEGSPPADAAAVADRFAAARAVRLASPGFDLRSAALNLYQLIPSPAGWPPEAAFVLSPFLDDPLLPQPLSDRDVEPARYERQLAEAKRQLEEERRAEVAGAASSSSAWDDAAAASASSSSRG